MGKNMLDTELREQIEDVNRDFADGNIPVLVEQRGALGLLWFDRYAHVYDTFYWPTPCHKPVVDYGYDETEKYFKEAIEYASAHPDKNAIIMFELSNDDDAKMVENAMSASLSRQFDGKPVPENLLFAFTAMDEKCAKPVLGAGSERFKEHVITKPHAEEGWWR